MFRYMSLIWDTANQQESEAARLVGQKLLSSSHWKEIFNHRGLWVLCTDIRPGSLEPRPLSNQAGVVLGTLFESSTDPVGEHPSHKAILDPQQSANIVNSQGERLVSDYWGNYVAFLLDPTSEKKWVIKSPTGTLPCFSTEYNGITIFFSCIADCVDLKLLRLTINESYLIDRIISGGRNQELRSINEVSRVYGGEYVEIDARKSAPQASRRFHWNPLNFRQSNDLIEDPEQAAREIRSAVRACTHALASCHPSIINRLSGGLDSSIISGCLRDAPSKPKITNYTYYNPKGRSDERHWARLAAQHAGCEHVECPINPIDIPLATALKILPSVDPSSALVFLLRATLEGQLARERKATAVFTGDGGDSGFCSDSRSHAVTEYLHLHGPRFEAIRLASHVALSSQLSTWTVLLRAAQRWLFGSSGNSQPRMPPEVCRLVHPNIKESSSADEHYPHPWLRSAARVPWGMMNRLGTLPYPSDFYNAPDNDELTPEVISPLYSQPVIELFLRIPIHVHFEGGRDRGLARRAFAQEVPQPILQRLWKDRAPGFHDELIQLNLDFLRELFLDGVLVKEGFLNRAAVEQALSTAPTKSEVFPGEIFRHMDTELWARQWVSQGKI